MSRNDFHSRTYRGDNASEETVCFPAWPDWRCCLGAQSALGRQATGEVRHVLRPQQVLHLRHAADRAGGEGLRGGPQREGRHRRASDRDRRAGPRQRTAARHRVLREAQARRRDGVRHACRRRYRARCCRASWPTATSCCSRSSAAATPSTATSSSGCSRSARPTGARWPTTSSTSRPGTTATSRA